MVRNVNKRIGVEKLIQIAAEEWRTTLDAITDAVCLVDLEGTILRCNRAMLEIVNKSFAEVLGRSCCQLIHCETKNVEGCPLERMRRSYSSETLVVQVSDRLFHIKVHPIFDSEGVLRKAVHILSDITERRKAEEALQQSEEKLRLMFDSVTQGIGVLDLDGKINQVNNALVIMLGYSSRDELIGRSISELTSEGDRERAAANMKKRLETGYSGSFEYMLLKKDGTEFPVEFSNTMVKDPDGKVLGFVAVITDITGRRQAEIERFEIEQKAQLASRLASIGEMAAGVAHEINNPLTGVLGYAQLLNRKNISEDIREGLEVINEGAERVAKTVNGLLTFARQQKTEKRLVNVHDILATTLEMMSSLLQTDNINIDTRFAAESPVVCGNGGQLQQVFINIITNAAKETKSSLGKGKIIITTSNRGKNILISFKDNGPGIAEENLDKIFDPFFTTRKVGEGTGLGLSICHGIITDHEGSIRVESRQGKGATFTIELPVFTESKQLEFIETELELTGRLAKAKILVVDDELRVRQFLFELLTEEGHIVETVSNADDALKAVGEQDYHLALLDIKMPGISGIELYKRFRKINKALVKKVIFITGDVLGKDTLEFLRRTRAQYITKPIDIKNLLTKINRMLS